MSFVRRRPLALEMQFYATKAVQNVGILVRENDVQWYALHDTTCAATVDMKEMGGLLVARGTIFFEISPSGDLFSIWTTV
jgi:hypothetical protein